MGIAEQCRFDSVTMGADRRLTVCLLDPDHRAWSFVFSNARMSISASEGEPPGQHGVEDASSITYLVTIVSRFSDGHEEHAYELETKALEMIICSGPVEVKPPS